MKYLIVSALKVLRTREGRRGRSVSWHGRARLVKAAKEVFVQHFCFWARRRSWSIIVNKCRNAGDFIITQGDFMITQECELMLCILLTCNRWVVCWTRGKKGAWNMYLVDKIVRAIARTILSTKCIKSTKYGPNTYFKQLFSPNSTYNLPIIYLYIQITGCLNVDTV